MLETPAPVVSSAAWLRLLLDSTIEGFYTVDRDGATTLCNQAFLTMLGFAGEEEALGRKLHGVIHHSHPDGEHYAVGDCPIYRCAQDGTEAHVTNEFFYRLDGSKLPVDYRVRPIFFEGELQGAICTFSDSTEQRAADAALVDALAAKDALLHEVNHRVKNSLQLAMALLSLQARQMATSDAKRGIDDALARIGIVAAVHQELYASGGHESVDIAHYLSRLVANSIKAFAADGQIELELDLTAGLKIGIDRAVPLALIVSEAVTNCMKYAFAPGASGVVTLSVQQVGTTVEIMVCDDGGGLPDEFTLATATGLGTKIITALARQIRAEVRYETRQPGTCFSMIMPADASRKSD